LSRRKLETRLRVPLQANEEKEERALGPFGPNALDSQEVTERFLVVDFASPTFPSKRKITNALVGLL
jgi:hypothetical protein